MFGQTTAVRTVWMQASLTCPTLRSLFYQLSVYFHHGVVGLMRDSNVAEVWGALSALNN